MKKILALIVMAISSWGMMTWAEFTQHPNWFYTGLAIAGILALGAVVWSAKKIAKFIGWSLSSCIYLILAQGIVVTLSAYKILPSIAGVPITIVLSGLLIIMAIRRLASKAQTSLFWGDLFSWITGYKLRNFIQNEKLVEVQKAKQDNSDRETIIGALRSLEFNKKDAEEATDYAIEEMPDATVSEKVKCALNYLRSNEVLDK